MHLVSPSGPPQHTRGLTATDRVQSQKFPIAIPDRHEVVALAHRPYRGLAEAGMLRAAWQPCAAATCHLHPGRREILRWPAQRHGSVRRRRRNAVVLRIVPQKKTVL